MCSPIDPQPVTIRRPEQNRTITTGAGTTM
jgi:hypothetical protein